MFPVEAPLTLLAFGCETAGGTTLERAVCTATGPAGLVIIGVYSFLIAWILPLPSEIVLAPAGSMRLGLGESGTLAAIVLASGLGKAVGSLFAFYIGQEVKRYGPLLALLQRSRFNVVVWSERKTTKLAKNYGYVGLAVALSVPFFPDTLSIYAFSLLEDHYAKFALATFAGSVGRLVVTLLLAAGALTLL